MACQIDQSGKIEQTNKNTVIALSNDTKATILLRQKIKGTCRLFIEKPENLRFLQSKFLLHLTYLLLEKAEIESGIVYIDKEYPGREDIIKSYITQLISKRGKIKLDPENIRFMLVGKSSNAHLLGYKAFKKGPADFKVAKEDILAMALNYES